MFRRIVVNILVAVLIVGPATAQQQTFECLIRPSEVVRVGAPAGGLVAEVNIERGDWVAAGEVIARLDTTLQEMAIRSAEVRAASDAELSAAKARVAFLTARLDRNRGLATKGVVATDSVEEIEAELNVAQNDVLRAELNRETASVELEAAKAEYDRRVIRSPIAGYVVERGLTVGEYWNEDTPLATIAAVDELFVEAIVGIEAYNTVTLGSEAMVEPEAPVGGKLVATVAVIDRVFDAASGTFGVRLVLPNPDHTVPAGLRCTVTFGD